MTYQFAVTLYVFCENGTKNAVNGFDTRLRKIHTVYQTKENNVKVYSIC